MLQSGTNLIDKNQIFFYLLNSADYRWEPWYKKDINNKLENTPEIYEIYLQYFSMTKILTFPGIPHRHDGSVY